jgi:hypothetical protein
MSFARYLRLLLGVTGAACLATCVAAGVALAAGGADIASAPLVAVGQQEFGNTLDGCYGGCPGYPDDGNGADYWKASLIAGDHVTVDWESTADGDGNFYANHLDVWPVGTTDYSISNVNALDEWDMNANGKAESKFVADKTGVFPLMFWSYWAQGPYDFTLTVHHLPRLAFSPPRAISNGSKLSVGVHYPDGTAVSGDGLLVAIYGQWKKANHLLGSGSPANGTAEITVKIPKGEHGKKIRVFAYASGSSFVTARTPYRRVRVK